MPINIEKKINELNPWFYPVIINGIKVQPGIGSTWSSQLLTNRIKFRKMLLVDEVIKRYDFKNKSILDLACNCGYWSAIYAKHGARYVLGVEGRRKFCHQARIYWQNNKFLPKDQYRFLCGDITDKVIWDSILVYKNFDVVLCAGILYHIPNYKELIQKIAPLVNDVLIIDTRVGDASEKLIEEPGDLHFNAIEQTRIKRVPHLPKLLTHLKNLKFETEVLPVRFKSPPGLTNKDDYVKKNRVTIFAKRIAK